MNPSDLIRVTSDVRRDLLASAAAFKNEAAVVWEYVVNSLQYVDRGTAPRVQVTVNTRRLEIEISDNGRGMTAQDLLHFFRMHGENPDRLRGRPGRGKFGTGKSAAFGIATSLRVATRRNGRSNVVVLTREMIDSSTGGEITPDWQVRDETTSLPNGTTIAIGGIVLQRLNTARIIEYIERHLQAFRTIAPQVAVNDHLCEYRQPTVAEESEFTPAETQRRLLGDVKLLIKVAQSPLPDADQGIAITAGAGNLVAVERAGMERKEFGSYLFGELDVPNLESFDSPLEAYDASRSLTLNPSHPVAAATIAFIGAKMEEVRLRLLAREREVRRSEEARRLTQEADRIAEILNEDFESVRKRLLDIRSAASVKGPASSAFGSSATGAEEEGTWVEGSQIPGEVERADSRGEGTGAKGRRAPALQATGQPQTDGSAAVDPAGGSGAKHPRPRGGFRVEYRQLGKDETRSRYDPGTLTILINLDHPVVSAALAGGHTEDPAFRRLSYEIAFSEYAMSLGYEMVRQDPQIPADDLLYEVRASLNRISTAAAALYR